MGTPTQAVLGSFSYGTNTQSSGTAITQLIPPYGGVGYPGIGTAGPGAAKTPTPGPGVIHVTSFILDTGATAHTLTIMRPQNYTWFSAVAAAGQAVFNLHDDPGLAANYKWPLANGQTVPSTANDGIAANDYVVYQAAPGQWVMDTVSSVATLAITMNTNLPTGGVVTGGLLFYFGVAADTLPITNAANQQFATTTSTRLSYTDPNGLWNGLHSGAPMIVYDPNATNADTYQLICGFYSRR